MKCSETAIQHGWNITWHDHENGETLYEKQGYRIYTWETGTVRIHAPKKRKLKPVFTQSYNAFDIFTNPDKFFWDTAEHEEVEENPDVDCIADFIHDLENKYFPC